MADPYFKRMQDYAEQNRRNTIDQATGDAPAPYSAPASGGMSQADFGGGKRKATSAQNAKLAELLKRQAAEDAQSKP